MKKITRLPTLKKWFFFNPLFVLYTDSPWFIEEPQATALKNYNTNDPINNYFYRVSTGVYEDPFDYDVRQMDPRNSYETESELINHTEANELRKQFRENETFNDFFVALDYPSEKTPIALITFVLSVFLATDKSLIQS